jgi:hypothetical protein
VAVVETTSLHTRNFSENWNCLVQLYPPALHTVYEKEDITPENWVSKEREEETQNIKESKF